MSSSATPRASCCRRSAASAPAAGRFRGLRLVHTHLRNEPLTRDDLIDLALLRLDLVAAIGVTPDGRPGRSARRPPAAARRGRPALARAAQRAVPPQRARQRRRSSRRSRRSSSASRRQRSRPTAATARCWSWSTCAGAPAQRRHARAGRLARVEELRELCRTAGVRVLDVIEAAPARARSEVPRRPRQARGRAGARDAARRQRADLRSRSHAGAGARDHRRHRPARSSIARC